MSILNKGFGIIKVKKQPDGQFLASCEGVGEVVSSSESKAILDINVKMKEVVESAETSLPFRILQ